MKKAVGDHTSGTALMTRRCVCGSHWCTGKNIDGEKRKGFPSQPRELTWDFDGSETEKGWGSPMAPLDNLENSLLKTKPILEKWATGGSKFYAVKNLPRQIVCGGLKKRKPNCLHWQPWTPTRESLCANLICTNLHTSKINWKPNCPICTNLQNFHSANSAPPPTLLFPSPAYCGRREKIALNEKSGV